METRGTILNCGKSIAAATILGALLFVGFVPRVYSDDDRAECRHRIEKSEAKLEASIRKHGEHSAQADAKRAELRAQRERCYNRIRSWWDGHERKWHEDRDWDDRH